MEACCIAILEVAPMVFDVGAPMKHKELCFEILTDAQAVIDRTSDEHFNIKQNYLAITMDMRGVVDVSAPLPLREKCLAMLKDARLTIQKFDDAQAPVERAFSEKLMG